MSFRLLLDEMTEAALAEYLSKMGHDVERVVDVSELGPGTDDGDVIEYVEREDRLLVTYDDDFLSEHDAVERVGVLFQPNERTSVFDTANIVNQIAKHVDQNAVTVHDDAYHLTERWL